MTVDKKTEKEYELHAKEQGKDFGNNILNYLTNWQGPSTLVAMAGYIASKNNIPIGKAQLRIGIGMLAAGVVAEIFSLRQQHPDMPKKKIAKTFSHNWLERIQGPSNVNLAVGIIGITQKIKGSEAAFIAGAIGSALAITPQIKQFFQETGSVPFL